MSLNPLGNLMQHRWYHPCFSLYLISFPGLVFLPLTRKTACPVNWLPLMANLIYHVYHFSSRERHIISMNKQSCNPWGIQSSNNLPVFHTCDWNHLVGSPGWEDSLCMGNNNFKQCLTKLPASCIAMGVLNKSDLATICPAEPMPCGVPWGIQTRIRPGSCPLGAQPSRRDRRYR